MTLLPSGATALERAIDATEAARVLPVDAISANWDPWRCPEAGLGYLAWALSIDLWDERWSVIKKRQACARSIEIHRRKGTLAGIRDHLELVDAELLDARLPRDRRFLRATPTLVERETRLATLPQIALRPFGATGGQDWRTFLASTPTRPVRATFDGGWDFSATEPFFDRTGGYTEVAEAAPPRPHRPRFLRESRGADLAGRRAVLIENGAERPLAIETLPDGAVRVMLPRAVARRPGFLTADDAESRVVTLAIDEDALPAAVTPSLSARPVRPVRVLGTRRAPTARWFLGRRGPRFAAASHAPALVEDRIALHRAPARPTRAYCGAFRLGAAPFTAELTVAVPLRRPRRRACRWMGVGFLKSPDLAPVARAVEAVRVSKALRDTVLVDTATHRPIQFGDGLQFGDFAFGQLTRKVA